MFTLLQSYLDSAEKLSYQENNTASAHLYNDLVHKIRTLHPTIALEACVMVLNLGLQGRIEITVQPKGGEKVQ